MQFYFGSEPDYANGTGILFQVAGAILQSRLLPQYSLTNKALAMPVAKTWPGLQGLIEELLNLYFFCQNDIS